MSDADKLAADDAQERSCLKGLSFISSPSSGDANTSVVTMDVHLGGAALFGPIGMVVAGALKGDIKESLNRFVAVFAPS